MQTINKNLVFHFRFHDVIAGLGFGFPNAVDKPINPKGGVTIVYNFQTKTFGVSKCSRNDVFNKKNGIRIATGRSSATSGNFGCSIRYDGVVDMKLITIAAEMLAREIL